MGRDFHRISKNLRHKSPPRNQSRVHMFARPRRVERNLALESPCSLSPEQIILSVLAASAGPCIVALGLFAVTAYVAPLESQSLRSFPTAASGTLLNPTTTSHPTQLGRRDEVIETTPITAIVTSPVVVGLSSKKLIDTPLGNLAPLYQKAFWFSFVLRGQFLNWITREPRPRPVPTHTLACSTSCRR